MAIECWLKLEKAAAQLEEFDVDHVVDRLMLNFDHWIGADELYETLVLFFLDAGDDVRRAVSVGDFQEVGVLLSEHVRKDIRRCVETLREEE